VLDTLHISPTALDEIRNQFLRELRVSLQLPVRVWGMDVNGKPFAVAAETMEISALGARLRGVAAVKNGEVIGIQYEDQKARFRVVWLGDTTTKTSGEIGVRSLDESKCIWSNALQSPPSPKAQAAAAVPLAEQKSLTPNRRRYVRYPCNAEVELRSGSAALATRFRLSDISLGGCYAETMSPLPLETPVFLALRTPENRIEIQGSVRTSHPSMGMGIGFTDIAPAQWKLLADYVAQLSGTPSEAPPGALPVPTPPPETEAKLEAFLRLLERKGLFTREEFLRELRNGFSH
jgi:hypothetical protein